MSILSESVEQQLSRFREREGEFIIFKGAELRAFVEEIPSGKAGARGVSSETYGIFHASAVGCIFDFSPQDFAPTTELTVPQEGDELIRNGLTYVVTNFDFENMDLDTTGVYCYALRKIWQDAPPE